MQRTRAVSKKIRAKAEEMGCNRSEFIVDAEVFAKFQALLEHPLPPTDRLRRLLKTKAP